VTRDAGSRHRAWVEVDHGAVAANVAALRGLAGPRQALIGVVKADAYGHGAVEVAATLEREGVERLAVATLSEAAELRAAGRAGPILLLWGIDAVDAPEVVTVGVEPMVDRAELLPALELAADRAGAEIGVHLKIDTGLGRQGIEPAAALGLARAIDASPRLRLAGTMTHLVAAEDSEVTDRQLDSFQAALDAIRGAGLDPGPVHVGGTGAILAGVAPWADAVRPGIGLYGLAPAPFDPREAGLTPALWVRSLPVRVFEVEAGAAVGYGFRWTCARRSRLATLPIGYGDGWPRSHLNNGVALVRGQRVPMVGAISMDGLVVDVTDAGPVSLDDEFVLIGRQGAEEITADEVAAQRGTISYEVTTMLRRRLPRRHLPA
jgi:alanine racemase